MLIEEAKAKHAAQTVIPADQEEGILSKLLKKDTNFATVMALDMIFGGIDTVELKSRQKIFKLFKIQIFFVDFVSAEFCFVLLS